MEQINDDDSTSFENEVRLMDMAIRVKKGFGMGGIGNNWLTVTAYELWRHVGEAFNPPKRVASVINVGLPADWVKVNVQSTSDCFEIYALVPGLLREEVRIQSDHVGRLIISGEPEEFDNPWGITSFKKVVCLPARIDPKNISVVVSLHDGLFIRVPYEQQPKMQSNVIS